jgi:hypothetical protein
LSSSFCPSEGEIAMDLNKVACKDPRRVAKERVLGMIAKKILGAICYLTLIGCCVACGSSGTRQGLGNKGHSIVVSPLSVQVADPKLLLSVSAVRLEKPVFRGANQSSASEDSLLLVLREVAGETLSMKVVEGARASKDDSILKTEIVTLEDLKGSSVGGTPARVAFRMWVYLPSVQRPVWQASYVFQQEAISENWLKLRDRLGRDGSGAGWITAQEIFRRGVEQSLRDFNSRRDAQFQSDQRK